ncbi:MAG TPA: nicotinate-nucleotide--dimethylbenzimidazole phosphoribosyltransferase [Spirochaetes bacterium]|nr:nicotinate-nucleotide--dimethylbenzimidazole phosphoribosyltransferase [Spirochaetota bacterium]
MLNDTIALIGPLDRKAMDETRRRLDSLLKPRGSLGVLETIAEQLAGITGSVFNDIKKKAVIVLLADNGVYEEGIASYPQEITTVGAACLTKGMMGINVLARHAGALVLPVDIGIRTDVEAEGLMKRKVRYGTGNIAKEPAMTREEAVRAIETGIDLAREAIDGGVNLLGAGEMGIGNTTSSSAVLYALTGESIDLLTGRGAGLDDKGLERKKDIIEKAVKLHRPDSGDPVDVLSKVGGLDIAGMAGVYLAAAARRVPVVVDGFIAGAAALTAIRLAPGAREYMIPSHLSEEAGAKVFARLTGLAPILNMNMRLGEGTGCALAFGIIEAAVKIIKEMGTFADIGM